MKKNIAIITARGGSKRIPKKNIKDFLGKPIIKYSIEAAISSGIFDEVMVSTDSQEIAQIALKCGAKVPFLRSEKNSDDYSTTADVILEVLESYKNNNEKFEYACCIYPTAPFVTAEKLQKSFQMLVENNAESIVPVCQFGYPIWRSLKIEDEKLSMNFPENMLKRSQDLSPAYHDAGQFYMIDVGKFLVSQKLFSNHTLALVVSELEVQDIDNETDWKLAEMKYEMMRNLVFLI